MHAIARIIQTNLNLRVFLPLLAVALGLTWYGLFYSVELFAEMTGGLRFVDMQPTITISQLFEQFAAYSESTTRYYIGWSLFDYAWPFVSYTAMLFITAWLLGFVHEKWRARFWLFVAVAYTTVLMDWGENTGFIALLAARPDEPQWLAQLTLALHAGKLVFNMVFNLGFWVLLLAVCYQGLRKLARRAVG